MNRIYLDVKNRVLEKMKEENFTFHYYFDNKKMPKKSDYAELNNRINSELTNLHLIKVGERVNFSTQNTQGIVNCFGRIISSRWKNLEDMIAIYDIEGDDDIRYRIITNQKRYKHDSIKQVNP